MQESINIKYRDNIVTKNQKWEDTYDQAFCFPIYISLFLLIPSLEDKRWLLLFTLFFPHYRYYTSYFLTYILTILDDSILYKTLVIKIVTERYLTSPVYA